MINKGKFILFLLMFVGICVITTYVISNIKCNENIKMYNDKLSKANDNYNEQLKNTNGIINTYKETINEKQSRINELSTQCAALENTIKKLMTVGKTPQNYSLAKDISRSSYESNRGRLVDVGEWLITYYCPDKEECGKTDGITYSGEAVIPGYTVAVDIKYWKLNTRFFVSGIGIVEAKDIGGAIKGINRMDICVFNKDIARSGSFKSKVYVIEER